MRKTRRLRKRDGLRVYGGDKAAEAVKKVLEEGGERGERGDECLEESTKSCSAAL
jgi:hypothetical protein